MRLTIVRKSFGSPNDVQHPRPLLAAPAKKELGGGDALVSGLMQLLLDLRNNLRTTAKEAAKDNPLKKSLFDQTDLIRKRLADSASPSKTAPAARRGGSAKNDSPQRHKEHKGILRFSSLCPLCLCG